MHVERWTLQRSWRGQCGTFGALQKWENRVQMLAEIAACVEIATTLCWGQAVSYTAQHCNMFKITEVVFTSLSRTQIWVSWYLHTLFTDGISSPLRTVHGVWREQLWRYWWVIILCQVSHRPRLLTPLVMVPAFCCTSKRASMPT